MINMLAMVLKLATIFPDCVLTDCRQKGSPVSYCHYSISQSAHLQIFKFVNYQIISHTHIRTSAHHFLPLSLMETPPTLSTFETEFRVRPDDIDMFHHVHNSKYFDYVLAARYDQMERCYGMAMEKFLERGFGWVVSTAHVDYKRALTMGDYFIVKTGIESINQKGCRVKFSITNKATGKICCDGYFDYVMIDMATGRGLKIPEDVIEQYLI